MSWEKVRAKRTEEFQDRTVVLGPEGRTYEALDDPELIRYVNAVKSREYPTSKALAAPLEVTKGTISKRKKKAIAKGLITVDEIRRCEEDAKQLLAEENEEEETEEEDNSGDF